MTYDVTDAAGNAAAQSITQHSSGYDAAPSDHSDSTSITEFGETYVAPTVTVDDFETLTATVGDDTDGDLNSWHHVVTYDATDTSAMQPRR